MTPRGHRLTLLVYLLTAGVAVVGGQQHGTEAPEHAHAAAPVPPPVPTLPAHGAAAAPSSRPATEPAHVTAPAETTKATPARAAASARPKAPDVQTVVERIQQRIDEEVVKPAQARAAALRTPSARAATGPGTRAATSLESPLPRRIRLSWRVALIWPDDLIGH